MLTDLPSAKPAFDHRTVVADPTGGVWVQRFGSADDSMNGYDAFDATGNLAFRIAVPARTHIVALSPRYLYLVAVDDDDLLWLRRHRR
jgi:hypothetical protein